jgi:hypothetical protein
MIIIFIHQQEQAAAAAEAEAAAAAAAAAYMYSPDIVRSTLEIPEQNPPCITHSNTKPPRASTI